MVAVQVIPELTQRLFAKFLSTYECNKTGGFCNTHLAQRIFNKNFPLVKAWRKIFEYLDGYTLTIEIVINLVNNAFDDIKGDKMSERQRHPDPDGQRRKQSSPAKLGNFLLETHCSVCSDKTFRPQSTEATSLSHQETKNCPQEMCRNSSKFSTRSTCNWHRRTVHCSRNNPWIVRKSFQNLIKEL